MQNPLEYTFIYIEKCNMCGSDTKDHKVMGKRLNCSQGRNPKHKIGISTTIMKCTDCNLIYSNPMPVPIDISNHYGILPENYWPANYFEFNNLNYSQEINILKTLMKIEPGHKSLEIGAGIGKYMMILEKEGFDAYGIEPSKPFYSMAIEKMGIKPDKLKLSSIENAEYPANHFDFIIFSAVLEHLYDPSAAIDKALNWVKPNGIIYIDVPSSNWLINKIINFYYRINGTDYTGNISPMHPPYHLYEFGIESFKKNAVNNKYEIAAHKYVVPGLTYMPKAFDFILKPYMEITKTGMQLLVWLKKSDKNKGN